MTIESIWIPTINIWMGLHVVLPMVSEHLCGERSGTHAPADFIGLVRRIRHQDSSLDNVKRGIAEAALTKSQMHRPGISIVHSGREDCGGVSFDCCSRDMEEQRPDDERAAEDLLRYAGSPVTLMSSRHHYFWRSFGKVKARRIQRKAVSSRRGYLPNISKGE
jgi:hypothetical protein